MARDGDKTAELHKLFRTRQEDQRKATTKRRRQMHARPAKCNEILETIFAKDSAALRSMEEAKALLAWEKYVGAATVQHARAEKIRGGQIIIRVSDPLWMNELSMMKNALLERYRKDFPKLKITDLYFTR